MVDSGGDSHEFTHFTTGNSFNNGLAMDCLRNNQYGGGGEFFKKKCLKFMF